MLGLKRVRGDIAILLDADGVPFAEGDLAIVAAAANGGRAALLLAAVDPVGELVIGADVIELGRRLIVPAAPRLAAIDADRGPLVAGQKKDLRMVGIDPDRVVIVAAGSTFDRGESLATVRGTVHRGIGNIDNILILGIDLYLGKVVAVAPDALCRMDPAPAFAGIVER
jgi:hypothetical protein